MLRNEIIYTNTLNPMYGIAKAIEQALVSAEKKAEAEQLLMSDADLDTFDDSNGDPETIYTIAAMYAQFVEGMSYADAMSAIEDALIEKYPEYL